MSLQSKILRGSALNLVDHVARVASMLVVTPSMVALLGLERYGLWLVLSAAISFLALLDGGITLSGTRYLARAIGAGDAAMATRVVGTLRWLYRRIGILCLTTTALLALAVPWLVRAPQWQATGRMVLLALGVGMSLRFFLRIHLVVLKSHLRYDLLVAASLAKTMVQTGLILWLLTKGHGLVTLALAQIASDVLDQLLVTLFSRRTLRETPGKCCRELLPEILRYSGLAFLNTTGQHLRSRIDPFVLSAFVGIASVPVYNMGLRLVTLFFDVVNALLGGTLLAGFSQVEGRDGLDGVRAKFMLSLGFSIPLALFGATGLAVVGPDFLVLWLGPEFAESGRVLRWLVLPYTLWLMQFPVESLFLSLNRHQVISRLIFGAGLFNASLSALLAWQIGFYGVIWATFTDMLLFYGLAIPWHASRVMKMPLGSYYALIARMVLKSAVPLGLLGLSTLTWLKPEWPRVLGAGAVIATGFATFAWLGLLPAELRARLSRGRPSP
jgi:O-antigen/teichoic acid export membrane protein